MKGKLKKGDVPLERVEPRSMSPLPTALLERRTLAFQQATSKPKERGGCKQPSYPMSTSKPKS